MVVDEDTSPNLVNFDDDRDDDLDVAQSASKFNSAVLYGTDWTVRTILQQIEERNIDLSPSFQRRDAWSIRSKSKFIESLALQIPVPQIILAERKEQRGTYIVLDGKQRLLTLAQFAAEMSTEHPVVQASSKPVPLKLSGLEVLKNLNGLSYADISARPELAQIKTQLDNHSIRSAIIRNWPDDDYLYEVFIRLNTGSSKLSPQELRQAMKPGEFTRFLNDASANSQALQKILGLSAPDFRMRDVDLLLRLIAFLTRLPLYRGNLKPFLDETQRYLNQQWSSVGAQVTNLVARIEDALQFLIVQFDGATRVGRRWSSRGGFDGPVNRAVLEVQVAAALCDPVRFAAMIDLNIPREFIELSRTDGEFAESIASTTKSISSIRTRFLKWQRVMEAAVGNDLAFPELPSGQ